MNEPHYAVLPKRMYFHAIHETERAINIIADLQRHCGEQYLLESAEDMEIKCKNRPETPKNP